jgi:hypothetical protein
MSGLVSGQFGSPAESGILAASMYLRAIFWLPSAIIAMLGATTSVRDTSPTNGALASCTAVAAFAFCHASTIGRALAASAASITHGPPR